eukprot:scaffold1338_cov142-Isochrysis_galbana.AAC.2
MQGRPPFTLPGLTGELLQDGPPDISKKDNCTCTWEVCGVARGEGGGGDGWATAVAADDGWPIEQKQKQTQTGTNGPGLCVRLHLLILQAIR